jgi:hypothetical protein
MLRMNNDAMEWVMDGMVDAAELWSLDACRPGPPARPA